jgi:hypothetical protein
MATKFIAEVVEEVGEGRYIVALDPKDLLSYPTNEYTRREVTSVSKLPIGKYILAYETSLVEHRMIITLWTEIGAPPEHLSVASKAEEYKVPITIVKQLTDPSVTPSEVPNKV